jgi:hypothetical protein
MIDREQSVIEMPHSRPPMLFPGRRRSIRHIEKSGNVRDLVRIMRRHHRARHWLPVAIGAAAILPRRIA